MTPPSRLATQDERPAGARLLFLVRHLSRYRNAPARRWGGAEGGAAVYANRAISGVLVVALALTLRAIRAFGASPSS